MPLGVYWVHLTLLFSEKYFKSTKNSLNPEIWVYYFTRQRSQEFRKDHFSWRHINYVSTKIKWFVNTTYMARHWFLYMSFFRCCCYHLCRTYKLDFAILCLNVFETPTYQSWLKKNKNIFLTKWCWYSYAFKCKNKLCFMGKTNIQKYSPYSWKTCQQKNWFLEFVLCLFLHGKTQEMKSSYMDFYIMKCLCIDVSYHFHNL